MTRIGEGPACMAASAYDSDFRAAMLVQPELMDDPEALGRALDRLDPPARDLAETLLLAVGPGAPVPELLRPSIEAEGVDLWRAGVLVPRAIPSPGATIDPRLYAGSARVNAALSGRRPLPELHGARAHHASPPPADARWEAVIIAALLEAEPPRLTQAGVLRRDDERRLLGRLGPDERRWSLALRVAQATGLARPSRDSLHGFPDSRPRPITDPATLLPGEAVQQAGMVLLRIASDEWVDLSDLDQVLRRRCPLVLGDGALKLPHGEEQRRNLFLAADLLHRLGAIDAARGPEGLLAIRRPQVPPPRPEGFLLLPNREILVAPGELSLPDYGRLCRLARFQDGDVVYRHQLSAEGLKADLAAGHADARAFLVGFSRTGLPEPVAAALRDWERSAERVVLLTGVSILEKDGRFEILTEAPPPGARVLSYERQAPASFSVQDGIIRVPFGQDALVVRALVEQIGEPLPPDRDGFRWRLRPGPIEDPQHLLDLLRRYHVEEELPAELEAAVLSAGSAPCRLERAVVLHLPEPAAAALQRDRVAGPLLERVLAGESASVVLESDLPLLRARLEELGFSLD